jgi:hypothetical protein
MTPSGSCWNVSQATISRSNQTISRAQRQRRARTGCSSRRGRADRPWEEIWERTIEVDVVLPRVAEYGASPSQLSYFVAKMSESWEVWYQIH